MRVGRTYRNEQLPFTDRVRSREIVRLMDYATPRILSYHGSAFNGSASHCHLRFAPDGEHVICGSDTSGYANVYLARVGDIDDLPELDRDRSF